jgi:hypothetical protein
VDGWPAALLGAAERIARRGEHGPEVSARFAPAAARLGVRDEALRLAADIEQAGGEWLGDAAQVYASLADRAAVDRVHASAQLDSASDPLGVQARTFGAAYQRLGDDAETDRIVSAIDEDARSAATSPTSR